MVLGLLCSGKLGFLLLKHLLRQHNISFVCTDAKSFDIIEMCRVEEIPLFIGNPRNGRIDSFLVGKEIDILVSINYLFLIESNMIRLPKKLAFNIHGSLLPKYRGRTPHVWAIINNEIATGITAHVIVDECDAGAIIKQQVIPISENDTGASLLQKYEHAYIPMVGEIIAMVKTDSIELVEQDEKSATYFGKRSPADGAINWNWQKERIRNWVRAQSNPYPGAFTHVEDKKVIIDKVNFSNAGFDYNEPNGLIKSINPTTIKTPNGVIELVDIREGQEFLITGKIAQS
jgi:methionyl-tRNA formyltransferase